MKRLIQPSIYLASMFMLQAQEQQPWSDYKVHDLKRPKPLKVETKGAVVSPAPADADVIFNGKNTDALTKAWLIKEGVMVATKSGDNRTKKSYGSCQVHIEWRVPPGRKVNGQQGGNSGIFLMDQYEIQVMASHTNETYADGQAGALYGQTPPLLNASRPIGEWQSYDIIFTAPVYENGKLKSPAYVTVIHNGVIIHNHQKYYGPTRHKVATKYPAKHADKAPIRLQFHGDPMEYRNFWVRDLSAKK